MPSKLTPEFDYLREETLPYEFYVEFDGWVLRDICITFIVSLSVSWNSALVKNFTLICNMCVSNKSILTVYSLLVYFGISLTMVAYCLSWSFINIIQVSQPRCCDIHRNIPLSEAHTHTRKHKHNQTHTLTQILY